MRGELRTILVVCVLLDGVSGDGRRWGRDVDIL